ncbi:MAP kinase kinase [Aureococcus anophagefferens]|nr:MAP kinase kinase [Aureococcus anophagefferens]
MVSPNRTKMLRSNSAPVVGHRPARQLEDRRAAVGAPPGVARTASDGVEEHMETSPRNGRALLGVLGQDLGLQMDLAAVDRDAGNCERVVRLQRGRHAHRLAAGPRDQDHAERPERRRVDALPDAGGGGAIARRRPWRRSADDLILFGELGRGACASVRRALHAPTLTVVAVKLVAVHDDARRRQLLQELAALPAVGGAFGRGAATGAMGGQDAEDFSAVRDSRSEELRAHRAVWRPEDDALAVVAHGIAGLAALHADRQLRDLKPSSVLLDWKWRVKLSDFGVSRAVDNTLGIAQTYVGTLAFMAPERIVGGDYRYGSDVWSIGLCFATCALGKIPLPQSDGYWAVVRAICDGDPPQLDAADGHDAHLVDITNACLARDAADRPDAATLLDHPFVRRGSSIYAAASKSRGRGAGPDFGFPVWHTQGDEETEPSPQQRDPQRDGGGASGLAPAPAHEPGRGGRGAPTSAPGRLSARSSRRWRRSSTCPRPTSARPSKPATRRRDGNSPRRRRPSTASLVSFVSNPFSCSSLPVLTRLGVKSSSSKA